MKKLVMTVIVCAIACGCAVPARIQKALETQAKYTYVYVEKTLPLISKSGLPDSEEIEGIGRRLVRNARELEKWSKGGTR